MKQLLIYLNKYKIETILAPLFKMLEASFELVVPLIMAQMIDVGIYGNDKLYIYKMSGIMILLGIIGLICSVTAQYFSAKAAMGFGKELRVDLYKHINNFSYLEIDNIGSATLITRLTSDINQVQTVINMMLRLFLRSPFIVFGAVIMALYVDITVATIFIITLPILTIIVFAIIIVSIPLYKRIQEKLDKVLLITRENLLGVRVIRAFNQQENELLKFNSFNNELKNTQLAASKISAILNPLTFVVVNFAIAVIIWTGAIKVDNGILTQGEVIALVNYMSQILVELVKLANLIISCNKAIACGNRIASILNTKSSMQFNEKLVIPQNGPVVEFKNVTMFYGNAKEPSLTQVSFAANRGDIIGIIGGTGSGKTTLVNLISRFYDCKEGEILINGINIKEYPKKQLRDKIGIVPQNAILFSGTIEENIRWGNEEASEIEILEAIDFARATDVIKSKDNGLEFVLNNGARNLSGGQKQRITIARALVKKPEILILDDSASALDFATEKALREGLGNISKCSTVFIVSQRPTSIINADKIIVLENGFVVAMGNHNELLKKCQLYKEICLTQLTNEEVDTIEKR